MHVAIFRGGEELARSISCSMPRRRITPEEDATGRTLWFDWMEYVGGRFEGSKIRRQIISVPGQRELGARRRKIIAGADVVVAVVDTSERGFGRSIDSLRELRAAVAGDRPIVVGASLLRSQLEPVIAVARIGERGQALQTVIDRVPKTVIDRDGIMSTLVALFA